MKLDGRVAVVTGAGSGLGRATALELADRGCALALVDINADGLRASQLAIEAGGATASTHVVDVSSRERMAELPDEVLAQHGGCHILVNNAGVVTIGRFTEEKLDDISWIVGINVFGVVYGCHYLLPVLREADEAHIVNVSSMAAFAGLPQNAIYSLTKGGVRSFTEALRAELVNTNVGVSTLFAGAIGTDIMDRARGAEAKRVADFGKKPIAGYLRRSPEAGARQIVKAIEHNKARVLLGPDARVLDLASRILPGRTGLLGRVLDRIT